MQGRLPFDILTAEQIVNAPYPDRSNVTQRLTSHPVAPIINHCIQPTPIQSISSPIKSSVPKEVRELDEEKGKKIIALIYERGGSLEKKGRSQVQQQHPHQTMQPGQQPLHHQSSYYMDKDGSANNSSISKSENKKEMNLLDKMSVYLSLESKSLIKHIDKEILVENGITIEDLIGRCECTITDLKNAGIVNGSQDLSDLGFKMSDVVIDRKRFQAQQLADLFQLSYQKLRKMPGVEFSVLDLLQCHFHANELAALSFSLDDMIQRGAINAKQLKLLNFSLSDLISLQFSKEHLELLGITRRQALDDFKWARKEYSEFTGEPMHNGKKRIV